MDDRAADEPDEDVESSREARIEHAADGVDHEREREQMAERGAAGRPRSGRQARAITTPSSVRLADPFRAVHAGQRGHDDPRRIAVVEREVGAVDAQREQRALVESWAWPSVAARNAPRGWSDSTRRTAPAVAPASAARSRRRTPVQRCVVDHPSTQAIGRSCCAGPWPAGRRATAVASLAPGDRQPPGRADQRGRDRGPGGGLVDRKASSARRPRGASSASAAADRRPTAPRSPPRGPRRQWRRARGGRGG